MTLGVNTWLVVGGTRAIDVGMPVVTFADDPTVDGHPYGNYSRNRGIHGLTLGRLRSKVRLLVLHHDATLSSRSCIKVLNRRNLSTHLLIDNDGTLFQMIDLAHSSWHGGKVNPYSIGLDLSNAASVRYASRYRDRGIFKAEVNGREIVALGYADPQYRTLIKVIRALARYFPRVRPLPPLDAEGQIITRQIGDVDTFEGVLGHFHLSAHKWDPGPGFDWKRVFNAVHGGGFQFPLSLTVGGDGGDLSGARFEATAERFYNLNESYPSGGWYPIGLNGAWHSGTHLHAEKGRRVNNIVGGEVVAARSTAQTDLGSPNFVLIRHKLKVSGEEKVFFSLSMHLDELLLGAATTRVPWLDRARAKSKPSKQRSDDGAFDDLDLDEEESAEDLRPKWGSGYAALARGDVAVFDPPEKIESGELVGYVGEYGPLDDATPQIDFSILAVEQIVDLKTFREDFEELSPDEDNNSLCNIDEVLRKVDPRFKPGTKGPISSEAVVRFFSENPERVEFRGYVARHISEWWSETDWSEALARRNVWAWDTRSKLQALLRKVAPFQWYNPELAEAVGLPDDGLVYTYHPIRFLKWLTRTQAGTKVSVDAATARGLTDEELKRARAQAADDQEAGEWFQLNEDGEDLGDEFEEWFLDDEEGIDLKGHGAGEWPPDASGFDFLED